MNINKNPFRYKSGEVMTHKEVRDLFANPPGFEMYKSSLKHCIIIGSKGSGKSILLKSLSIQVQSLNANIEELDYCGIYIELIIQANKFVELSKKFEMNDIFEHYFTLVVIAAAANQLSDIVSEGRCA